MGLGFQAFSSSGSGSAVDVFKLYHRDQVRGTSESLVNRNLYKPLEAPKPSILGKLVHKPLNTRIKTRASLKP